MRTGAILYLGNLRNHLPPLRVVVTQELAALDPSAG
jgi:hypothetical protein